MKELTRAEQILQIILSDQSDADIRAALEDYHENDIADAVVKLDADHRKRLYHILGAERVSEIFTYLDDVSDYMDELSLEQAADVLGSMDADDAVDMLEDIEDEEQKQLIALMDKDLSEDIRLIQSFEEDEVGSMMTTNFVTVPETATIKETMRSVVRQAEENDNINTIYAVDASGRYAGAITLKDLIVAREYVPLDDIISRSYPSVRADDKISEVIGPLKDYAEDSIPVLDAQNVILGVITADDVIEAVDDEMGDDYAKLAGLTADEDLHERLIDSMKKRLAVAYPAASAGTGGIRRSRRVRAGGGADRGGDVLPVADPGYGRQRRHPVAGGNHPRADGREPLRTGEIPVRVQGNPRRRGERTAAGRAGLCRRGGVPVPGEREHAAPGVRGRGMRRRGALPGHADFELSRHADPDAVP